MTTPSYPKTPANKLGRLANRGSYDYTTIHTLLNTCPILHVSFTDPDADHPFPVVLPMLGCTGNFENQEADPALEPQDLYLHGYVSGRMFRRGREAGGDAEGEEGERGLPMTVAASFLDGLVLSLTPFHNSCNYRSAIAHGYAHPVTSPTESLYALRLITDSLLPSRWSSSRTPPTPAELSSTGLLRIRIVSASAKVRVGGPKEDRKDLKNEELVASTWTGVVPFWGTWGDPVTAEGSGRGVEGYVEEWRVEETEKAREYAVEAVGMKGK
ncbi:hypothetical protein IAQ61_011512 [Plenodomus lingam]|nr:hypothetical protein IAQ61_011512 [Plenodomus lingam]